MRGRFLAIRKFDGTEALAPIDVLVYEAVTGMQETYNRFKDEFLTESAKIMGGFYMELDDIESMKRLREGSYKVGAEIKGMSTYRALGSARIETIILEIENSRRYSDLYDIKMSFMFSQEELHELKSIGLSIRFDSLMNTRASIYEPRVTGTSVIGYPQTLSSDNGIARVYV
jgi:hypothetical protein